MIEAKTMFGMNFPERFKIGIKEAEQAKQKVVEFSKIWSDFNRNSNVQKKLRDIYGFDHGVVIACFINTSPYSMDNYQKGYISVSIRRDTSQKMIGTVIHELSHFLFRKHYTDFCRKISCTNDEIEDIKEILTVINNDVFPTINDKGYEVHQNLRKNALEMWRNKKNIQSIITESLKLLRNKNT